MLKSSVPTSIQTILRQYKFLKRKHLCFESVHGKIHVGSTTLRSLRLASSSVAKPSMTKHLVELIKSGNVFLKRLHKEIELFPDCASFWFGLVWLCCRYYSDPSGSNRRHSPAPYKDNTTTPLNTG